MIYVIYLVSQLVDQFFIYLKVGIKIMRIIGLVLVIILIFNVFYFFENIESDVINSLLFFYEKGYGGYLLS